MKNKFSTLLGIASILLLTAFLNGCFDAAQSGGGSTQFGGDPIAGDFGGGASGTGNTGGGSSGTGKASVSVGTISAFGSVFINGVRYDTTDASITIDGKPASESDLHTGMIARITGNVDVQTNTATASTLEVTFSLVGAVEQIDLPLSKLIVVGQNVTLTPFTVFVNGAPEDLSANSIIAVSGLTNNNGTVIASYIEFINAGEPTETTLSGEISNLDRNNRNFRIGEQTVNYALSQFIDTTETELANGLSVRVVGQQLPENVIEAGSVQSLVSTPVAEQDDILDLEGIVREPILATQFLLGNTIVATSAATEFIGGGQSDIIVNTRLKVRGKISASGTLQAERVEFSIQPDITVTGGVELVDAATNRVSISGLTIVVDNSTRMLDVSSAAIQRFSVSDIQPGDVLTVYGSRSSSGIKALFLRRDALTQPNPSGIVTIRGLSKPAGGDPFFEVSGISVDTTAMIDTGTFRNVSLNAITRSEFFTSVQQEALVEVTGIYTTPTLTATSASLLGRGNITIMDSIGSVAAGANDLLTAWDGSLNTEIDVINGTTSVNMFITSKQTILGFPWFAHDIRVFGPGRYTFDTCANQASAFNCGILQMTVGPDQIGVHMLLDWNLDTNVDVVVVWDQNNRFCADIPASTCTSYSLAADGSVISDLDLFNWNFAATDHDQDGIAGVVVVDGSFANSISISFNLEI